MNTKRLVLLLVLVVGMILGGIGVHSGLVPPPAFAQGVPLDTYVAFTVAPGTGPVAATLVAGVSGKKISIKAIHVSSSTSGSVHFYDGTALTTTLTTAAVLANQATTLDRNFFLGGADATGKYPTGSSGNALGLTATGGTVTGTIRINQQ